MEQRDYLKDQIDQMAHVLGAMLSKISALMQDHRAQEVESMAQESFMNDLNVNLSELTAENVKDFNRHIHSSFLNDEKIYKPLANMFETIGDAKNQEGKSEEAKNYYHKAIELLEFANQEGSTFSLELNSHIQNLILKHKAID